jgi:hypothetical protein
MGWSHRKEAGVVLDQWKQACLASSGCANVFSHKGKTYIIELSRTEHWDGAVTGKLMRCTETRADGSMMCVPSGSLRIEGDGTITRAHSFLKAIKVL